MNWWFLTGASPGKQLCLHWCATDCSGQTQMALLMCPQTDLDFFFWFFVWFLANVSSRGCSQVYLGVDFFFFHDSWQATLRANMHVVINVRGCSGVCLSVDPHFASDAAAARMLQCVVVCCSVLQCVAVCCSVLQCVVVWRSVLQCVVVLCQRCCCCTYVCVHFPDMCFGVCCVM